MKKRKNYFFLAMVLYATAAVVVAMSLLGKIPMISLLGAVFCIALGGTLSGVQANREFNDEIEERRRAATERRKSRRNRRI